MTRKVIAAVTDLFFVAKMQSAARLVPGVELVFASSMEDLLTQARAGVDLVVLDLEDPRHDNLEAISRLRADPETASVPVVAFYSHVQAETAALARAAGCDQVWARSKFSARLADLLNGAGVEREPPIAVL